MFALFSWVYLYKCFKVLPKEEVTEMIKRANTWWVISKVTPIEVEIANEKDESNHSSRTDQHHKDSTRVIL